MRETIDILSAWSLTDRNGTEVWVPTVILDHPGQHRITRLSANPANPKYDPDQSVVRYVGETAQLDAIELDENYAVMVGTRQPYVPPEAITFTAEDLGEGKIGFLDTPGNERYYRGARIGRIFSSEKLGTVFALDIDVSFPVPQNIFEHIQLNGTTVYSAAATYNAATQTWAWFGVSFAFVPGTEHTITIVAPSQDSLGDIPSQPEYAQWRNAVATQKNEAGQPIWNPGQLNVAVGTTVNGRTWGEINQDMNDYLAVAPPLNP